MIPKNVTGLVSLSDRMWDEFIAWVQSVGVDDIAQAVSALIIRKCPAVTLFAIAGLLQFVSDLDAIGRARSPAGFALRSFDSLLDFLGLRLLATSESGGRAPRTTQANSTMG